MNHLQERFLSVKRGLFDLLYADLNERQRAAVYAVNGPVLVLAGAGSGKTTVLVRRIAHIIRYGNAYAADTMPDFLDEAAVAEMEAALRRGDTAYAEQVLPTLAENPCPPYRILSITFTNKAAGEMKTRLSQVLGKEQGDSVWAGTFHSICLRFLRKYAAEAGLTPGFTIFDAEDSKRAVGECIKNLELDEKVFIPKAICSLISQYKNRLLSSADMASDGVSDYKLEKAAEVFAAYEEMLRQIGAVDFDDIIGKTVALLKNCSTAREDYRSRFRYICIDEYQDTNKAQFELARLLSEGLENLMVVGDDDQSIYRFRGATIENILRFDKIYPHAAVIKLEQNYRSTGNILAAANAVIAHNTGRHAKKLWSAGDAGALLVLKQLDTQIDEGNYILSRIESLVTAGKYRYRDFALLYRMNAQSNALEKAFVKAGIPHRILGGTRFYERKEIKDIIAYLCVVSNRRDDMRLKRIINEPKRKIGNTTIEAIEQIAHDAGCSMFEVMRNAAEYPAIARNAAKLGSFCDLIDGLSQVEKEEGLPALFEETIKRSGYQDMLLNMGITELDRLENIRELISNAVEYSTTHEAATLAGFLEEAALVSDIDRYDEEADAVVMMTVHSAKGLEFPVVFLPGMEDGIFPGLLAKNSTEELEEERRLAYVAITRAKDMLFLTHVRQRMFFGRTQYNPISPFAEEIPKELLRNETEQSHHSPAAEPRRRMPPPGGITLPGKHPSIPPEALAKAKKERFLVGQSVLHPIYGRGDVLGVTEMGGDTLYEIAFDTVGTKKLMASFARLKAE